jgi:surface polysaccharide O-acyltransferase-like enzyme
VFELALNLLCVSGPLARLVSSFRSKVAFHTALGYAGFFVLGHYLANYQLPACAVRALHALGALSLAFTVGGTLYLSLRSGSATEALIHNLLPNTAFVSASIFLLVKRRFEHSAPSPRVARAVGTLSKLCFGAYLVHDFFIILFRKLGILSPNFFPALSVLLIAAAVMALSLLAAHLLNKIPVLNRYIL